jgi:ribosome-binding factor A
MFKHNRSGGKNRAPDRKLLQLCSQIQETLIWVLGSVSNDDILPVCSVIGVEPLPGNNRLLVKIGVPNDISLESASQALAKATNALRAEVAQSITRRKAPELVFLPLRTGQ